MGPAEGKNAVRVRRPFSGGDGRRDGQHRFEEADYDGTNCLAVVDGTPVSLVARADVVDLIEAVNEIVLN